jgi:hypothetical protein
VEALVEHCDDVIDQTMLRNLAVIAAANNRSVVAELNVAVGTYVLNQIAQRGEDRLVEDALRDPMNELQS